MCVGTTGVGHHYSISTFIEGVEGVKGVIWGTYRGIGWHPELPVWHTLIHIVWHLRREEGGRESKRMGISYTLITFTL